MPSYPPGHEYNRGISSSTRQPQGTLQPGIRLRLYPKFRNNSTGLYRVLMNNIEKGTSDLLRKLTCKGTASRTENVYGHFQTHNASYP